MSVRAALGVVLVELAVPGGWGELAWVPLVVGLLLGLPHGAVDHLLPARHLGWQLPGLAAFAVGYAALAAAGWLAFRAAPGAALLVFVLVSVWHFGTGETAFADLRAGRPVQRHGVSAVVLGAVVLCVPLARGSAEVTAVVGALAPGSTGMLPGWLPGTVLAAVLPAAAVLLASLLSNRRGQEAWELAVLAGLVLLTPPLVAFGTWFGCWHSVRHVARLLAEDPANAADLDAGRLAGPLSRFAAQAALPTVAVLVVLGLLWSAAGGWRGFVVADLPVLAALTLPHVLVVAWLDVRHRAGRPGLGDERRPGSILA